MAAETPTTISNMALVRCGAKEITSFEDDVSREAQICRRLFHAARRTALAQHTWTGATRDVQLSQNSSITPVFWEYAYTLPTDMLRIISVHPSDNPEAVCNYSVQNANSTEADNVLLSDSNQIYLRYVFDNTDLMTLSDGFREVLTFVLARDLCMSLGKSANKYQLTNAEYKRALTMGKSIDGIQKEPQVIQSGSWAMSRYGKYTDRTRVES
jgi:hypothetical protein